MKNKSLNTKSKLYNLKKSSASNIYKNFKSIIFTIKEEQLNIVKNLVTTGEVNIYRKTFTKDKSYTIPIKYEELIIESRKISADEPNKATSTEIIRIPLSEEHVDFTKHVVNLENVSLYKKKIENIRHIDEILKKEKCKIKIHGNPKVVTKYY